MTDDVGDAEERRRAEDDRVRARHGDAPRWVLRPVLLAVVGIPVGVVAYGALTIATQWLSAPSPGPAVSVVVVGALLWLLCGAVPRRPLTRVDRTYFRLAVFFVGGFGVMGTWRVGAVVGVLVMVHSLFADRVVKPSPPAPVVRMD